ncbi:MAG: hypothetical protein ACLTOK_09255 [Anaerobutyricum soehngenii]
MITLNDNFTMKKKINGKSITIGQQNFDNMTILIKEKNENVISCPMGFDNNDDCYFIYDSTKVYIR